VCGKKAFYDVLLKFLSLLDWFSSTMWSTMLETSSIRLKKAFFLSNNAPIWELYIFIPSIYKFRLQNVENAPVELLLFTLAKNWLARENAEKKLAHQQRKADVWMRAVLYQARLETHRAHYMFVFLDLGYGTAAWARVAQEIN
jgi:hypothetical protein